MNEYLETGRKILRILNDNGHHAYFVGGFVRDFLLGVPSSDIDVATSATPDQVTRIFPGAKATGVKYGTVTVYEGPHAFEITTFRREGGYQDSRHPGDVDFTTSLDQDLERRDFTVNAIAMDGAGRLHDHYGGRADLDNHILRAIGAPAKRFQEDALRILRAFRFVAKLGFTIEPATFEAIRQTRDLLANISNERVIAELKYITRSPYADRAWGPMAAAGIPDVLTPIGSGIRFLAARGPVRLAFEEFAALCFRLEGGAVPAEWRFSNKERQSIERIMMIADVTAADAFDPLLVYVNGLESCLAANAVNVALDPARDQEAAIRAMYVAIPIRKTCDLAFKGDDILQTTNLRDARKIGGIINELIDMVVTGRLKNEFAPLREHALGMIRKMGEHDGRN